MRSNLVVRVAAGAAVSALCACATPVAGPGVTTAAVPREEILVLRSLRQERIPESAWCSTERAGFAPFESAFLLEDRFTMWSVKVQQTDGRISDPRAEQVGVLRTCFGRTRDPKVVNFYAEGQIAGLPAMGNGECVFVRTDFPQQGITSARCHLSLRGLPAAYAGGLLTTNSIVSKAVLGNDSDPPGYTQTSIATIRLWRAP